MKFKKNQFTASDYKIWESGLLLPESAHAQIFSVNFRKAQFDICSRITLKANNVNDALEKACYAITHGSTFRPEDIDLLALYDQNERLLWLDEAFQQVGLRQLEFAGMDRRNFLKLSVTAAALFSGFLPRSVSAGTTSVALSGSAAGFGGEQLYTTAGSYTWTVPAGVTSVSVLCIGGGGGGGFTGNAMAAGLNACTGGGGGLRYINSYGVTPAAGLPVVVGAAGLSAYNLGFQGSNNTGSGGPGGDSIFNTTTLQATGGGGGSANPTVGGGGAGGSGTAIAGSVGGGNGGTGGGTNVGNDNAGFIMRGGGGGAGGYSAAGGAGGTGTLTGTNGSDGSGGGGGGGASGNDAAGSGIGGGVGLYGTGTNGVGGVYNGSTVQSGDTGGRNGAGGSGGNGGQSAAAYGGGGEISTGRIGAVRIIWGAGRSFPSSAA